jgi:predicted LPLAT superfamily acyltransferase
MAEAGDRHWAHEKERGSFLLMRGTAAALRYLGRKPMAPVIYVIVLYFFVFGRRARRNVRDYQARLAAWGGGATPPPTTRSVFAQFMAFATSLLDRLDAWQGKLRLADVVLDDPHGVRHRLLASQQGGRGQILVGAHLGSLDVCRALAELGEQVPINVLVHTRHTAMFNQLQQEAGDGHLRLLQVSELDAAVMMQLSQRLDRGEWLAIAGDRVPIHGGRSVTVDFLGHRAAFPQGPWLLAGLLRCPVNLLCCIKVDGRYRVVLEPFLATPAFERGRRDEAIAGWVARYAERLGALCLRAPQQWFNFFAFWQAPHKDLP